MRAFEVGALTLDLRTAHCDLDLAGLRVVIFGYRALAYVLGQRTFEALVLPNNFHGLALLCNGDM
jgi:hypothetical protein